MPLGTEVDPGPGHNVLDGNPAPPPKRRVSPQLPAHAYCSHMAGWINMKLGMEVASA